MLQKAIYHTVCLIQTPQAVPTAADGVLCDVWAPQHWDQQVSISVTDLWCPLTLGQWVLKSLFRWSAIALPGHWEHIPLHGLLVSLVAGSCPWQGEKPGYNVCSKIAGKACVPNLPTCWDYTLSFELQWTKGHSPDSSKMAWVCQSFDISSFSSSFFFFFQLFVYNYFPDYSSWSWKYLPLIWNCILLQTHSFGD